MLNHLSFVFYSMFKYVYFLHNCLKYVRSMKLSKICCFVIINSHLNFIYVPILHPDLPNYFMFFPVNSNISK